MSTGLLTLLLAVWAVSGAADFVCHRAQRIEHSAGLRETLLHGLLLIQGAVPPLIATFAEINRSALAIAFVASLAHELTTWVDLRYASGRRVIPWYEQAVHGVQQAMPWMLSLAMALSVAGAGDSSSGLRLRDAPPAGVAVLLVVVAALIGAQLLMEFARAWRALRGALAATR